MFLAFSSQLLDIYMQNALSMPLDPREYRQAGSSSPAPLYSPRILQKFTTLVSTNLTRKTAPTGLFKVSNRSCIFVKTHVAQLEDRLATLASVSSLPVYN